jgi:hypothetical protein
MKTARTRTTRRVPSRQPRCCRRPGGRAFLRFFCRQDAGYVFIVAQIFNLPYRRFVIGRASDRSRAVSFPDTWQSATLRYSRLQVCATGVGHTVNTYDVGGTLHGKPSSAFAHALGPRTGAGNPKRRRGGALQNLAEDPPTLGNAPASWRAAVLRRFPPERALEIGFMGILLGILPCVGTMNRYESASTALRAPSPPLGGMCLPCEPRIGTERGIYPAGTPAPQTRAGESRCPFANQPSCGLKSALLSPFPARR